MRILIVDDHDDNLYFLRALLEGHGHEVESALHGEEALEKSRRALPDVVISDLLMPVMDGYTLLRHWMADERLRSVPFIVYTGTYTSPEDEELALDLGADAFIAKPAEPDELLARIRAVVADAARGSPKTTAEPVAGNESDLFKQYSEILVRKLEEKSIQLEAANAALQTEIAERRQAAETVQAILDALPAHIALLDSTGCILTVNLAWRAFAADGNALSGTAIDVGLNYIEVCERAGKEGCDEAFEATSGIRAVLNGNSRAFAIEYPCHSATEEHWFQMLVTRVAAGGAVIMHLDVTARKLADRQLAEQAALLDIAREAIIVCNLDDRIVFWNRGAEVMYGWSRDEIKGRKIGELVYGDPSDFQLASQAVVEQGYWSGHIAQRRKDGTILTVQGNWTLVRDERGRPRSIFSVNTDITEQIAIAQQLRQAQRLEAVGQLTGGIAHDFNNFLTVILGYAELLAQRLADEQPLHLMADSIKAAAERGSDLTKRLLAFSRRQILEPKAVDMRRLLADVDPLLRRTLPENIEFEIVSASDLWTAWIDPGQLENAILNLCINARDAMPDGGNLTVEAANTQLDQDYADQHAEVTPGQYVAVTVSDTGTGIPADIVEKVFDPFFTTKDMGRGSGLGLSMVYGFAKQSAGHVKIYSEVGQGTAVKIYLPRAGAERIPEGPARSEGPVEGGTETILMVEDDELVRSHVEQQLRALGYVVWTAGDGPEAVEILRNRQPVDLLFTDMIMPGGMNGRELAEAACRLQPNLPVLFTSGYAENAIAHQGRLGKGVWLLAKPYRQVELARAIRAALSRRSGSAF